MKTTGGLSAITEDSALVDPVVVVGSVVVVVVTSFVALMEKPRSIQRTGKWGMSGTFSRKGKPWA